MILVDLATAKGHLRVSDDSGDDIIMRELQNASTLVVDYLKLDSGYYDETNSPVIPIPDIVVLAVLLVLDNLHWRPEIDPISPAVESVLRRSRDPAIA